MIFLIGELWSDFVNERFILCFPDSLNLGAIDVLLLLYIISMAAFRTLCLRLSLFPGVYHNAKSRGKSGLAYLPFPQGPHQRERRYPSWKLE